MLVSNLDFRIQKITSSFSWKQYFSCNCMYWIHNNILLTKMYPSLTSKNIPSTANPSGSPAATFGESYLLRFQWTRCSYITTRLLAYMTIHISSMFLLVRILFIPCLRLQSYLCWIHFSIHSVLRASTVIVSPMGMKLPELIFPIQTTSSKSLTVKLE